LKRFGPNGKKGQQAGHQARATCLPITRHPVTAPSFLVSVCVSSAQNVYRGRSNSPWCIRQHKRAIMADSSDDPFSWSEGELVDRLRQFGVADVDEMDVNELMMLYLSLTSEAMPPSSSSSSSSSSAAAAPAAAPAASAAAAAPAPRVPSTRESSSSMRVGASSSSSSAGRGRGERSSGAAVPATTTVAAADGKKTGDDDADDGGDDDGIMAPRSDAAHYAETVAQVTHARPPVDAPQVPAPLTHYPPPSLPHHTRRSSSR